jgi:transcriptional antiterminator RfaH
MSWYVVRTQANAEPRAAENLLRQGYEVYLPLGRRWRLHARRREVVSRPLFPRYLFVAFDKERARWRAIFSTIGVSTLICQGEMPIQVPDGIVEEIQASERNGQFDDAGMVARLKPGDPVLITCGPFSDLTGQLQSLVAGDRVRVLLQLLGRQVPTVLDLQQVAPA